MLKLIWNLIIFGLESPKTCDVLAFFANLFYKSSLLQNKSIQSVV